MYHIFFIYSSVDGHLGCFHDLAIVNSAAMNIGVHDSFWIMVFSGYMPSSGIARSYGSSIFRLLRNLHMRTTFNAAKLWVCLKEWMTQSSDFFLITKKIVLQ